MLLARFILGGVLAVVLSAAAFADVPDGNMRPAIRNEALMISAGIVVPAVRPVARPEDLQQDRVAVQTGALLRPLAREDYIPTARWDDRQDADDWTRATLAALTTQAAGLDDVIPRDIETWCPNYAQNPPEQRRAFWVGMMSALAHYESTMNPRAVGGGGQWYGLLQIYPPTARHYGCEASTGEALRDPEANLACAARIMAVTVARDEAVALHDGRWLGVAADWGPMTSRTKREAMSAWTREQDYCSPVLAVTTALRPMARPDPAQPDPDLIRLAQL